MNLDFTHFCVPSDEDEQEYNKRVEVCEKFLIRSTHSTKHVSTACRAADTNAGKTGAMTQYASR